MSKTKRKSRSSEEHQRGQIRELQKLVKSLQKQLKQYEKYEHKEVIGQDDKEVSGDSEDTFIDLKKRITCKSDSCSKGYYEEIELMGKLYGRCITCGDQRRLK